MFLFQSHTFVLVIRWSYSPKHLLPWFQELELRLWLEKLLPDLRRRSISNLILIVDFVLFIMRNILSLALTFRVINLVYFFRLILWPSFLQSIFHRLLSQLLKSFSCFRRELISLLLETIFVWVNSFETIEFIVVGMVLSSLILWEIFSLRFVCLICLTSIQTRWTMRITC